MRIPHFDVSFRDNILYLGYQMLKELSSGSERFDVLDIGIPPNSEESRVEEEISQLLAFLKIDFCLDSGNFIVPFFEENISSLKFFLELKLSQFSLDEHVKNSMDLNVLPYAQHIKVAQEVLQGRYELYGDRFIISQDDFFHVEGVLFIYLLLFLESHGAIEIDFIFTQNGEKHSGWEVFAGRVRVLSPLEKEGGDLLWLKSSDFDYDSQKGMCYKGVWCSDITPLEMHFCEYFYNKMNSSALVATEDVLKVVYGNLEGENLDALKSLIKRMNRKLWRRFSLKKNPIKYSTSSIKKEI